jgi:hypothetical protein
MIHDIVSAVYEGGYRIGLRFDDEKVGTVDFSPYLERGGVFERFKDIEFFKNFKVNEDLGTLTWQGEIDVAPETLYAEATGTPLPHWMDEGEESATNTPAESTRHNHV